MDKTVSYELIEALNTINAAFAAERIEFKRSAATVRVIGEFSSGKTRLMNELFGGLIPQALMPVSSRECQTIVPLEITYGNPASLSLIERICDEASSTVLQTLSQFPTREEILKDYPQINHKMRLELTVPEPHLCVQTDGIEEHSIPRRLTLIDMPGWNNDDFDAERDKEKVVDKWTFALVYVLASTRIDSQYNQDELTTLLELLQDEAWFLDQPTLVIVVTHCEENFHQRATEIMAQRIKAIKTKLNYHDLAVKIQCVDFQELTPATKTQFTHQFWENLFSGWEKYSAFSQESREIDITRHLGGWNPFEEFQSIRDVVLDAETIIYNFFSKADAMIPSMNTNRLVALKSSSDCYKRLWSEWEKTIGPIQLESPFHHRIKQLKAGNNPFAPWWNYFVAQPIQEILKQLDQLLQKVDGAFEQVYRLMKEAEATPDKKFNLNQFFVETIKPTYLEVRLHFEKKTKLILDKPLHGILRSSTPDRILATLIAMTCVQDAFSHVHRVKKL